MSTVDSKEDLNTNLRLMRTRVRTRTQAHMHIRKLRHPWGPMEGADSENTAGSQGNGVLANGL